MNPDGTTVRIAPGSVVSLTPGVAVTSVNEAEGTMVVTIPNDTPTVQLSYRVMDAAGQPGNQVYVAGFSTRERHQLQRGIHNWSANGDHTYCMANFNMDCADASNAGCDRCAIYQIMQACNYVIVKSATIDKKSTQTDPETGSNFCLMNSHYIVMPTAACTGVDDNKKACTGDPSKAYWDGAVRHGYNSGAGDLGGRYGLTKHISCSRHERGQHQMHIHVAPLDKSSSKGNILLKAKGDNSIQTDPKQDPTVITLNKQVVAAYFIKDTAVPPTVANHDIYSIAAGIHASYIKINSLSYDDLSYGVALIPKKGGFVVAAAYGFADVDVMDTSFTNTAGFCQASCTPFH
ncbi:hypothetical protein COO60DRAFT_1644571 [Scenedesmus sp. NREL 46B-D3]|nr:hypothetical protein COO60DRAFT_1644571 [Scenedesmus sp. NREL 46B-D3]